MNIITNRNVSYTTLTVYHTKKNKLFPLIFHQKLPANQKFAYSILIGADLYNSMKCMAVPKRRERKVKWVCSIFKKKVGNSFCAQAVCSGSASNVKAKFHYASWFEAGCRQVRSQIPLRYLVRTATSFEPASNQIA